MKLIPTNQIARTITLIAGLALASTALRASDVPATLDDYSNAKQNKNGAERLLIDDQVVGSKSHATVACKEGVLSVKGELVPGRGAPAFISEVSPVAADGKAKDLSGFTGVRLKVKVIRGALRVQVATTAVTNFDYHTSDPVAGSAGEFREVRIPFAKFKRGQSAQTALDLKTVTSINLVSFGLAKDNFAYEVDEIGLY